MIDAVIFDMDGLLIDSEPCWSEARRRWAEECGVEWTLDDQRACMGVSTIAWAHYVKQRLRLDLPEEAVIRRIVDTMHRIYATAVPYLPGALHAIDLAWRNYPVALASGSEKSLIMRVIDDAPLRGKFRAVVCTDDMAHGKPAPDVYLEAARQLGVAPGRCVCLEDSGAGIMAGVNAGMKVIAVPDHRFGPNREIVSKADVVLPSLEAFDLDLLRRL